MSKVSVSVVVKAKNEAHQIVACLESVANFASELIVVDDDSSDDTADLAAAQGARVIPMKSYDGMIDVLDREGFKAATQSWILRMDADERLTPTLEAELRKVLSSPKGWAGVRYSRRNIMFGQWAQYGGWFRSDQVRFFRADAWDRNWTAEELHTQVPVVGPILTLPSNYDLATVHYDYDSVDEYIRRTLWRYSLTDAKVAHKSGRPFSGARLLLKPAKRFWGKLIIRQGLRDGWRGVILAGMLAAYDFCIEANLWDIQQRNQGPTTDKTEG